MLAYCTAADLPSGLLIYAAGEGEPAKYRIDHAEKTIEVASLDLFGSSGSHPGRCGTAGRAGSSSCSLTRTQYGCMIRTFPREGTGKSKHRGGERNDGYPSTSINIRQWSLGPHSATPLRARARTPRWNPRDANT